MGILLLILACGGKKPAAAPAEPVSVETPASSDWSSPEGLARMTAEIVPLLEKHAQRTFDEPPVVEVFDPKAFVAYNKREAKLVLDTTLRDTPPHVRAKAAASAGEIRSIFGKYGIFDKKVYVVPEAIERAATEDVSAEEFAKIVLAHELAHALQNQEVEPVPVFEALVDLDHFHCWSSVSEGGANFLAIRVARDLGIEDSFWALTEQQGWGKEGLVHPLAYSVWMSYGRGMQALEEAVSTGGMDLFWQWHAAPPASSAMLFAPETYSPTVPEGVVDLAPALVGTEQLLTKGDWMLSNNRLGEYSLRGEAIRTGKVEEFETVLEHLVSARHLQLEMSPPEKRRADIRVLRFDSPEAAASYVRLLRAEQTVEAQTLAKMIGRPVEVAYDELKGIEGDANLLRTQFGPTVATETRTVWVARGADIVAVRADGFRPGLRLGRTLTGVFERLDGL